MWLNGRWLNRIVYCTDTNQPGAVQQRWLSAAAVGWIFSLEVYQNRSLLLTTKSDRSWISDRLMIGIKERSIKNLMNMLKFANSQNVFYSFLISRFPQKVLLVETISIRKFDEKFNFASANKVGFSWEVCEIDLWSWHLHACLRNLRLSATRDVVQPPVFVTAALKRN